MRFIRFGERGNERPGIVDDDGAVRDLSGLIEALTPDMLSPELIAHVAAADGLPVVDLAGQRIGAAIARPGTIWCIGLNYVDHANEAGMAIPSEPVVFSKAASALSGPNDAIPFTDDMTKLDWEVELGIVIGRPAFRVSTADALDHVFGYTLVNDVSERAWQLERGGQWIKGKSHPGFCPAGPWLVTRDEVPDPQALALRLEVNGEPMQDGTTADMIFPVAEIVSYLSRFARLEPGDLICTGTPAGVGAGMSPARFLKPGDSVRLTIDGLGEQTQRVEALS
ncbi:MAG TPA: fumarylacetoacetate hydrolase family protein [Sphingomonas sp.]|nr:fumarylacetoacetate hydrolase family protein [Sphingomonas sp.]